MGRSLRGRGRVHSTYCMAICSFRGRCMAIAVGDYRGLRKALFNSPFSDHFAHCTNDTVNIPARLVVHRNAHVTVQSLVYVREQFELENQYTYPTRKYLSKKTPCQVSTMTQIILVTCLYNLCASLLRLF